MSESLANLPNLDDLSVDSTDYRKLSIIYLLASQYCRHKSRSIRYRQENKIDKAIEAEKEMKETYEAFPISERW